MSYPIEQIAEMIGARRIGEAPATIDWLLTDSRSLNFPEETLFFALPAKRNTGANYIPELIERGVRCFVVSEEEYESNEELKMKNEELSVSNENSSFGSKASILHSSLNFLLVPSPLKALQKLAELHRAQFSIPVVGITGSNGKTVVKEWLHQLLGDDRRIVRSPRSYNSQIGVPLSVWQMGADDELAIFEAGISEPGEMRALEAIIKPTIGILTNGPAEHQRRKIEGLALNRWFAPDHIFISGAIGLQKPDPRAFWHVQEALRLKPEATWYIGDSPSCDVKGALDAGWHMVFFNRRDHAASLCPDVTITTEEALIAWITKAIAQ